jgi:hypothetical protein
VDILRRPLFSSGGEGEEKDQDRPPRAQPGVERKIFLVST